MKKGDSVITDSPDSTSGGLIRSYGLVYAFTKAGVVIELADGSMITRQRSSIAVYIQPPKNWQELYRQQISLPQPTRRGFNRGPHARQQDH